MIKANIILDHFLWKKKINNPENYLKNKKKKINKIKFLKKKKQEFSVLLTNNRTMKKLNLKFRKKNKPTDVLSFPMQNITKKNNYIGDIAISYQIVNKRAKNSNFFFELDKMWIHGYLHLLGHDHKKNKDYYLMKKKENLIFKKLNKIN